MGKPTAYLTAEEAAALLGVTRQTLYAYASRGLLRSEPARGDRRARRYRAADVAQLHARRQARRDPRHAAEGALQWGFPVVESALTLITERGHYYRGQSALALAADATLEEVAALLWLGDRSAAGSLFPPPSSGGRPAGSLSVITRMQEALIHHPRGDNGTREAAQLLWQLASSITGAPALPVAEQLQRAWLPTQPQVRPLLDAAMILCADHELNVSSFTARCVASAGAPLAESVLAGLAALQGVRHGGYTFRVAAMLRDLADAAEPESWLADQIVNGTIPPGFHHRLYPSGDPRGTQLIERAAAHDPTGVAVQQAMWLVARVDELIGERPTVDFGLVVLASALALPADAPFLLFALGRTVGWLAHALEQAPRGLVRPRARYIGLRPQR